MYKLIPQSEYVITDKMLQTNLPFWLWVFIPLWTEVKTAKGATQFINAIQ